MAEDKKADYLLEIEGRCPICEKDTRFVSKNRWLRGGLICTTCPGGSVPRDADTTPGLDRPSVVINFSRLRTITPIDDGKRLVCLAGAGIQDALHKANALGVDSHSELGSFFLNPTVAAGVAFGSGGTQLRKVRRIMHMLARMCIAPWCLLYFFHLVSSLTEPVSFHLLNLP